MKSPPQGMKFLLLPVCYIVLFTVTNARKTALGEQKPHIVLIVADDLGWNDVSWHNAEVISPHLASLAAEGVILERSYVQPICSPSRAALMTARYPFTTGRQNNIIWPRKPTGLTLDHSILPQELKKLGYDTHIVGKWHLGFCKWEYTPTYRGFDTFTGFYTAKEDYWTHVSEENGYDFRNGEEVFREANGTYSAFIFADRVSTILQERNSSDPVFLYIPFQSVHKPVQAPQEYIDMYEDIEDLSRRELLAMISVMDDAIGTIVDSLKSTGHYENSVIVFTTDNGGDTDVGGDNWPLHGNKTTLWEGGTRGPAFIHSPFMETQANFSDRLIHIVDWMPTFLDMAGGEIPEGIDGVSQWEALNNFKAPDARNAFVYDIDATEDMRAAIRDGQYKLIVGDPGAIETPPHYYALHDHLAGKSKEDIGKILEEAPKQLYDVNMDPSETLDIADMHPEVVDLLLLQLEQHMDRYVTKDDPPSEASAGPENFDMTWSPGWC